MESPGEPSNTWWPGILDLGPRDPGPGGPAILDLVASNPGPGSLAILDLVAPATRTWVPGRPGASVIPDLVARQPGPGGPGTRTWWPRNPGPGGRQPGVAPESRRPGNPGGPGSGPGSLAGLGPAPAHSFPLFREIWGTFAQVKLKFGSRGAPGFSPDQLRQLDPKAMKGFDANPN